MDAKHQAAIHELEINRQPVMKALVIGDDTTPSNVQQPDNKVDRAFNEAGALIPPHDPTTLCMLLEHSNALRQNIDAYQNNIDGFGHRFEPVMDPETEDGQERIANAMYIDAVNEGGDPETSWPTDEALEEKTEWLRREMRRERMKLKIFFEYCCPDTSFIEHRKHTRQDLEVMGNGYWEVLRNNKRTGGEGPGEISQFVFIPGHTVRLMPLAPGDVQDVDIPVPTSELSQEVVPAKKKFRRYIQSSQFNSRTGVSEGKVVYFKELHDPRVMSAMTGKTFNDVAALKAAEKHERQATEIIHFKIHSPRSSYGVPRWIGALLAVLGNRQAEEVNFMYFENKSVPPLAITVSGGRMTTETVDRITSFIDDEIRGKKNFHKILVLEADTDPGSPNSGKTKIEIHPLTDSQQKDALFQNYDERNIDKVGQAFRLPRMLRGDIRDFNRSTAEAALVFAEMQVFQPEREEFDWIMNRKILSALGIQFWKFASMGPVTKDQKQLAEIVALLVRNNIITPGEARVLTEDVVNKDLPKIDEFWTEQPVILTQQGFIPDDDLILADGAEPGGQEPGDGDDDELSDDKVSADTSTSDLDAGGKKKPAQGSGKKKKPRRQFRRLPPMEKHEPEVSVDDLAFHLLNAREKLRAAELKAEEDFLAGKKAYEDDVSD